MNEFEIKVRGVKPPSEPVGKSKHALKVMGAVLKAILMRPRRLIAAGLVGYVVFVGTPHAGWDYQCDHPMRGPGSCRSVAWCAYYGIQGRRIEIPEYGESCKLFTILPLRWGSIMSTAAQKPATGAE